jgi:hypothetical protein
MILNLLADRLDIPNGDESRVEPSKKRICPQGSSDQDRLVERDWEFWTKSKGNSDFLSQMLTAPFYQPPVVGDIAGIRNHQRELLRREVGYVRCFHGSYLIRSAEGFGKTSSHFPEIQDEMFDIALAQP